MCVYINIYIYVCLYIYIYIYILIYRYIRKCVCVCEYKTADMQEVLHNLTKLIKIFIVLQKRFLEIYLFLHQIKFTMHVTISMQT